MEEEIDIFSLANLGLKKAENNSNCQSAEIFFHQNRYINVEIEENSVKHSEMGEDFGASIRMIDKRGSLGFAITNILTQNSIKKMVNSALNLMKSGTGDPDLTHLPSSYESYPTVKGLYKPEVKHLQIEDTLDYAEQLIQVCKEDEEAISQSAGFSADYSKIYIFNTNGLEIHGKDTTCSLSSNIIVKDPQSGETSSGYEWQSERDLKDLNATQIAHTALENAKRNLNRIKINSLECPLILTPKGAISFILRPIASAVNAESFQYNRTFLVGRKEQGIGSELLQVEDNALIDGAVGSAFFDGEGVPCKNKKIIEQGKFLNILHNSYTAGKEGVESTGNAARGSYESLPSIGISNLILQPGSAPKEEMIQDISEGILIDYTGDSPNIATGDFSGLILQGNLIKNGEIDSPLNETMFAVNLLDLYKNIEQISRESEVYGAYHVPYVKIKQVQFVGSA